VYRDTAKADILYHRSRKDFEERMEWLGARAASPASTPEAAPEQQQAVSKRAGFDEAMQAQHGGTLTKEDLDTCWSELPGYAWRRAADAAHAQQPAAPEGWKMVPIVPTDWMIEKAASLPSNGTFNYEIYQAMVNAAPTAGAATTSEDARDAARYRGWRDHMLAEDKAFVDAMQDFMPPDVGASRDPTASEWDFAIDAAMRATQQEGGNA
jgi:hypothetical protein